MVGLLLIGGTMQTQTPRQAFSTSQPGTDAIEDLDPTFAGFAGNGKTAGSPIQIRAMALQADEKILVAGQVDDTFALARYNANGTLDTSFGTGGVVKTKILSAESISGAMAVALQPDNKIVAAGYVVVDQSNFAVVRYNPDGSLDNTFSGNGKTAPDFNGGHDWAHALAIDSVGRLLVAGRVWDPDTASPDDYDMGVMRFNPDGSLDSFFDNDGKQNIGYNNNDSALAIALQPDGKIVLGGTREESCFVPLCQPVHVRCFDGSDVEDFDFAVVRLHSDGTLDTSFDGDGRLSTEMGGWDCIYALAVQPDGKIVAAGETWTDGIALARYLPNGALDSSFGDGGRLITKSDEGYSSARAVAVQPNGKIVIAGVGNDRFALMRYTSEGSLDNAFGEGGKVFTEFLPDHWEGAFAMAMQADGRILAVGTDYVGGTGGYLARYLPDGSLDTAGRQLIAFGFPVVRERAYAMLTEPGGKLVTAGFITESTDQFALARLNSDGSADRSFGDNGRVIFGFGGEEQAYALARTAGGSLVAVGSVTSPHLGKNFMIVKFSPTGVFECFNVTDFEGGDDQAHAVAIQADGKIVAAGEAWGKSTLDLNMGVVRYNADCTVDSTFAGDGKTMVSVRGDEVSHGVLVPSDGTIVLGGYVDGDILLARLTASGNQDSSFGDGGRVVVDWGGIERAFAMTSLPDGRLIVAGHKDGDMLVARFSPDGVLDTSFGANGVATATITGADRAYAVTTNASGSIFAAGCGYYKLLPFTFVVAQFLPDGSLDPGFSDDGKDTATFGDFINCAHAIAFTNGYKIVTAGYAEAHGDTNFALARFLTEPPPLQGTFRTYLPLSIR